MNASDEGRQLAAHARELAQEGPGGVTQARRILEEHLRSHPEDFPPLDAEVEILTASGEVPLAIRLIEEYIRYYPENGGASARLAWIHWETGRKEDAFAEIRATLARDPGDTKARQWLAEWSAAERDHAGALRAAEEGLAREPDDRGLLLALARAAAHLKDESRARTAFSRVVELHPDDAEAHRHFAMFLLGASKAEEAVRILQPLVDSRTLSPETALCAIEAHFRAGQVVPAIRLARRLGITPGLHDEEARALLALCHQNLPAREADELLLSMPEVWPVADALVIELVEHHGSRAARENLNRLYNLVSQYPLLYPRSMARILSTYLQLLPPGAIERWVAAHWGDLEQNATLWGGVGAWHCARGRWEDAIHHLSRYEGRPGVRQWMIHLLGKSLETVGRIDEANLHYRRALELEPDHSEPGVRSRLAFNVALEGMPAAGHLMLVDCSEKGRKLALTEDFVRIMAVETLATAGRLGEYAQRKELFDDVLVRLRQLAMQDPSSNSKMAIRLFRRKAAEMLAEVAEG